MSVYYNAPIELWRGFLDNPKKVLEEILNYTSVEYDDKDSASKALGVTYWDWKGTKEKGNELRKRKDYTGVIFSISYEMYWDYRNHAKDEHDNLLLLGYLALKSIGGHNRISFTNSAFMFCRMAGYGRMSDLQKEGYEYNQQAKKWFKNGCQAKETPAILNYMRTDDVRGYHCEKLRYALMESFDNFHCYSRKGKRGFAFIFDNEKTREEYWKMMAKQLDERGNDKNRNQIKEQMRKATWDY